MAAVTHLPLCFESIDEASAALILQLQLSDIDELRSTRPGKQREGNTDDVELAAALLEENLENVRTLLSDRRMTKSIAEVVQADGNLLAGSNVEEEVACEDHAFAHRLNGSNVDSEVVLHSTNLDDQLLAKLAGAYVSEELGHKIATLEAQVLESEGEDSEPETSAWAAARKRTQIAGSLNHLCEACHENKKYFDVIAGPCRHEYCRDCIRDLFSASLTDESLFPPRCCRQNIPLKAVSIFLTKEIKEEFEKKKVEFGTPNRTYCSQPTCSTFIKAENIVDEIAFCPDCTRRTCSVCKGEAHEGEDCPNDTALQQTLDLATESGWQRCYSCRRMVELDIGTLTSADVTTSPATVVPNSATPVHLHGVPAVATSGTKTAFLHERIKSSSEMLLSYRSTTRSDW